MLPTRTISTFKKAILGERYALAVFVIPPRKMRALNLAHRGIDAPTDILSFPYSKSEGEIYLCKSEVTRHAKEWGQPVHKYLPYLVMHGMIHLRGLDHGARMDALERRFAKALSIERPQSIHAKRSTRSRD